MNIPNLRLRTAESFWLAIRFAAALAIVVTCKNGEGRPKISVTGIYALMDSSSMNATPEEEQDIKPLVQDALNANREYQSALDTFATKLAADLHELDVLLDTAKEADTDSAEEEQLGAISVPGGKKARAPINLPDLLSVESPFFEDALKRETYSRLTTLHSMRQKDLDALKESVQTENYRICAFSRKRE
jgi:hypothetical protein